MSSVHPTQHNTLHITCRIHANANIVEVELPVLLSLFSVTEINYQDVYVLDWITRFRY